MVGPDHEIEIIIVGIYTSLNFVLGVFGMDLLQDKALTK